MSNENETKYFGGLNTLPVDNRDISLGGIFPSRELPPDVDFTVSRPLGIKDQKNSSMCVAFATSAVSEDEEGVSLSPEWFYAKIKEREGDSKTWGSNLRDAMKVATKKGFLKQTDAPYSLDTKNQEFLADWNNWPQDLDNIAQIHRKQSYVKIKKDSYKDYFDAIRASLWQFRAKNQSVATGLVWHNEWIKAKDGIIKTKGTPAFGHAFKIYGQRMIQGEPYLVAQLSNGDDIGDNGIFYMSREVINDVEEFGAFMLIDLPRDYIEILSEKNWTIDKLWLAKVFSIIRNFFKKYQINLFQ